MKFLIFLGLVVSPIFFYGEVRAEDMSVINVRRNIQLSESDPVYKDFYIDGGEDSGLKKNMVVQATRKINIRDASGAHAFGEIKVPVGQLKIIAVYPKLAVAREFKLLSRDDLPMLEQVGIMTGDQIETKGSFIDRKPNAVPAVVAPAPAGPMPASATAPPSTAPAPVTQAPVDPPAAPAPPLVTQPIVTPAPPSAASQSQVDSGRTLN